VHIVNPRVEENAPSPSVRLLFIFYTEKRAFCFKTFFHFAVSSRQQNSINSLVLLFVETHVTSRVDIAHVRVTLQ